VLKTILTPLKREKGRKTLHSDKEAARAAKASRREE